MPGRNKRVAYLYDNDTGNFSYGLGHPMKPFRIRMAHQLVASYGMLDKMQVLRPRRSTPQEMTAFHTDEYIDFLNRVTPETAEELTGHGQRFLVGEDNPAFEGVFDFCSISAGGSIGAAQRLNIGAADIAINWAGGLHHAKKREASGFCYINDIVLAILELLRVFPRVLYIDIDCHHGDGVEEAFYTTDRVLTCSFHKFGEYFPGTGHVDDRGTGKGLGYSVNVPLKDGLTDDAFKGVFEPVIQKILEWYRPEAVVLQCGADSLSGDKLGCFNITMEGHANCVQFLRASGIPLILLGGGGYTIKNVARVWTYETACALGIQDTIDPNLPWNEYFEWFGPRYRLEVPETNMEDVNIRDGHLEHIKSEVLRHLEDLPFAPSVGMHHVPTESIGDHLGYSMQEDHHPEELSDLDEMIAARVRDAFNANSESLPSSDDADLSDDSESSSSVSSLHRYRSSRRRTHLAFPAEWHAHHHQVRHPPSKRRKFFSSSLVWNASRKEVLLMQQIPDNEDSIVIVADQDEQDEGDGEENGHIETSAVRGRGTNRTMLDLGWGDDSEDVNMRLG